MGAKEVSPPEAPGLHAMIERLCIQADLPKPRIAVADTHVPNAFACGRSQKSATVCATTGIMSVLSPSELEGVMAHELTHVKNRDVLIMTIASFFASLASIILQFGFFFGGDDDDNPSILVVLLVSFVVYIVSFFLMLALSRYREFAADRGAAIITGRPSALSSALVKISGAMERVPTQDLRQAERLNAFFIVPTSVKGAVQTLFATHPPMEKRIAASSSSRPAPGRRLSGLPRRSARWAREAGQGRGARPPVRDDHRAGHARHRARPQAQGRGGDRLPAARDRRLRRDRQGDRGAAARRAEDTGTAVESSADEYGYRWLIFRDPDFEDLVVALNTISTQLQESGYGDRLLAAVFPFEDKGQTVYFIYNFKRGAYYPFIPAPGDQARDSERELRLKAQVGAELPFEEDITRWFPLWEIPL